MDGLNPAWLVTNAASGSNAEGASEQLEALCSEHGLVFARHTRFPDDDLPDPAALDAEGVRTLVIFTGDGTVNSLLTRLRGWGGAVLILPGGTMNLVYHRLHGDRPMEQVVAAMARGDFQLIRPGVIRCDQGNGYAEVLAGPGTSWGDVREAMRDGDVPELASSAMRAMEETLAGDGVACAEPQIARPEGYPLISLRPRGKGIDIVAYYAESTEEYLEQALALVRRNFRDGPHETLGHAADVRLAGANGQPFGILVDGEQIPSTVEAGFRLAPCEVDLIATANDAA
ncbi:MAG TPA: diacylglycerol kinase family protein [Croceibacterium sp.]|nr:diacylglycerol kinase family protein [Croceibacterium sp.]